MIEKVDFDINVFDNFIEIIPKSGVLNNSEYVIKISSVDSLNKTKTVSDINLTFLTAFSPCYCKLDEVKSIVTNCGINDKDILYHTRAASKFADYLMTTVHIGNILKPPPKTIDPNNVPFEVEQFVKYKSAYDCILRLYVDKSATDNEKGTLGDVSFENQNRMADISKLLGALEDEVQKWQDIVRGFGIEGRSRPVSAIKSLTPLPQVKLSYGTPMQKIDLSYNRGV